MKAVHPVVLSLLEYRMSALAIGQLALRHTVSWEQAPSIEIYFDRKQVVEGTATAFTNGAIEAAIVHGRALLEFLGLKGESQFKLKEITDRRKGDDIGIEQFFGLKRISIQQAVLSCSSDVVEAEAALAYVIYLANKGLAHTTASFMRHGSGANLLAVALGEIPRLIIQNFHEPLQINYPEYEIQGRRHL